MVLRRLYHKRFRAGSSTRSRTKLHHWGRELLHPGRVLESTDETNKNQWVRACRYYRLPSCRSVQRPRSVGAGPIRSPIRAGGSASGEQVRPRHRDNLSAPDPAGRYLRPVEGGHYLAPYIQYKALRHRDLQVPSGLLSAVRRRSFAEPRRARRGPLGRRPAIGAPEPQP